MSKPTHANEFNSNEDENSNTVICHCTNIADRYRRRSWINPLGYTVFRCFYRCRLCHSRIYREFIKGMKDVNVLDLIKAKHPTH